MNRDTGESPGENRGPLLLYFLCLHPPDRPSAWARVTFGRSGPLHRLSLCLRRPHFFQQRKKWGKERRQKPMVFGIPFVRSQLRRKKAHAESLLPLSPLPLPRAAGKCRIRRYATINRSADTQTDKYDGVLTGTFQLLDIVWLHIAKVCRRRTK